MVLSELDFLLVYGKILTMRKPQDPKYRAARVAKYIGKTAGLWRVLREDLTEREGKQRIYLICECIRCGDLKSVAADKIAKAKGLGTCANCSQYIVNRAFGQEMPFGFRNANRKIFIKWRNMIKRCYDPKDKNYVRYGASGTKVEGVWSGPSGFVNFVNWTKSKYPNWEELYASRIDLDRIDVWGDYSPENCRYISHKENCRNLKKTIYVSYLGEEKIPLIKLTEEFSLLPYSTVQNRIYDGWNIEEALITPKGCKPGTGGGR